MILSLADAGTPLMWVGVYHLAFGNLVIGLVEGFVIARATKAGRGKAIAVMIGANYLSMIVGWVVGDLATSLAFNHLPGDSLRAIPWIMLVLYALLCGLTCAVEYPVAKCLRNGMSHRVFLRPFLLAQLTTTVPLGFVFASASFGTIYTEAHVQARADFLKPIGATMYYLSGDNDEVRKLRLDTGVDSLEREVEGVTGLNVTRGTAGWELEVGSVDVKPGYQSILTVPFGSPYRLVPEEQREDDFRHLHQGIDWRPEVRRIDRVGGSVWAAEGLVVGRRSLGLEMPFLAPRAWNATALPTDQVIYCLGGTYILLLDLDTMRLGTLMRGSSPVVVLDAPPVGT